MTASPVAWQPPHWVTSSRRTHMMSSPGQVRSSWAQTSEKTNSSAARRAARCEGPGVAVVEPYHMLPVVVVVAAPVVVVEPIMVDEDESDGL